MSMGRLRTFFASLFTSNKKHVATKRDIDFDWLRRTHYPHLDDEQFTTLRTTAIHEAGHALMAYFVGWTCRSIQFEFRTNGTLLNGQTEYDFGDDLEIIQGIFNNGIVPRNDLERHRWVEVAFRRAIVCYGGLVAERNYSEGIGRDTDITGPNFESDHRVFETTIRFVSLHGTNRENEQQVFEFIERDVFNQTAVLDTLDCLAYEVLLRGHLSASQIDAVLNAAEFRDFIRDNNYKTLCAG